MMSDRLKAKAGNILKNLPSGYELYYQPLIEGGFQSDQAERILEVIFNLSINKLEREQATEKLTRITGKKEIADDVLCVFYPDRQVA